MMDSETPCSHRRWQLNDHGACTICGIGRRDALRAECSYCGEDEAVALAEPPPKPQETRALEEKKSV